MCPHQGATLHTRDKVILRAVCSQRRSFMNNEGDFGVGISSIQNACCFA